MQWWQSPDTATLCNLAICLQDYGLAFFVPSWSSGLPGLKADVTVGPPSNLVFGRKWREIDKVRINCDHFTFILRGLLPLQGNKERDLPESEDRE